MKMQLLAHHPHLLTWATEVLTAHLFPILGTLARVLPQLLIKSLRYDRISTQLLTLTSRIRWDGSPNPESRLCRRHRCLENNLLSILTPIKLYLLVMCLTTYDLPSL
jgi:hypothetical protein